MVLSSNVPLNRTDGSNILAPKSNNSATSLMDKVAIKIPRELYEKPQGMIEGTGFSSVTEFIVFVMLTLASSGKIKEEVKKRLRALGYLE